MVTSIKRLWSLFPRCQRVVGQQCWELLCPCWYTTPNIGGRRMLGVVVSVLVVVCKRMQQLPTTRSNKQQGVQTDATCKIQQCWELLANNVASDCRGALVVSYSYFSFDAVRSRNTIKSIKFCRMIDISLYYLNFFY